MSLDNSKFGQLMSFLLKSGMATDLNNVTPRNVIPTGCPPLNYVLGHNGVPEGVLMEVIGPESSGKCVDLDTIVEVHGQGLCKMRELVAGANLPRDEEQNIIADTQAPIDLEVGSLKGYERADGVFFAGTTNTIKVWTRESASLSGTPEHRVLTLTEEGNLRWTALQNLRPNDQILSTIGTGVEGELVQFLGLPLPRPISEDPHEPNETPPPTERELAWAYLLGTIAGSVKRSDRNTITLTSKRQKTTIEKWAQVVTGEPASPFEVTEEGNLCEEPPSELRLGDKIVARIVSALPVDPGSYVAVRPPLDLLLTTKSSRSHFRRRHLSFADGPRRSSCRDDVVPALRTTYGVQVDICGHCKETSQRSWNHVH